MKKKLYCKLSAAQNFRKVVEMLYIFLITPDEVQNYVDNCICHFSIKIVNHFDLKLQLIKTKPLIKNKLKELLSELKCLKSSQY